MDLRLRVKQHNDWYRQPRSFENHQVLFRALDDEGNLLDDRVVTLHVNPPPREHESEEKKGNEGWQEFLSLYQKNSEITYEQLICIPNGFILLMAKFNAQ